MAADSHIHVLEGVTEDDLAIFNSSLLGSKWFSWDRVCKKKYDRTVDKIEKTPQIWIGEVSWLKASLLDNDAKYIPSPVGSIEDIIDEDLPIVDDALIKKIMEAFDQENITSYKLADPNEVRKFLEFHKGKRLFTVSW